MDVIKTKLKFPGAAASLGFGIMACLAVATGKPGFAAEPSAFDTWARHARIGGAELYIGMADTEMETLLNDLANQNVSVIEADSGLSNYQNDAEFEQELALMRSFAQKAHAHAGQFRVVWYYPALEVLTPDAAGAANTMSGDHPDWLQWGIDSTPNVFVGGSGQVFWVEPGMESAWMSPSSPYRDYFYARATRIAKEAGIDGLWIDVPIYSNFGPVRWADANPYAVTEFESKTGAKIPAAEDWADYNWRRWIVWRHEELRRYLSDAAAAVRTDNPEFALIVETLPTDYNATTVYGIEGADLRPIEGVTHVWEVDTLSNNSGMRNAAEDDWISYISMQKYIKAASGHKPAWSFAYGKEADDAELIMAEILAAGNNPYELQIPLMATTVGAEYRARMFGWIKANENDLWRDSAARVAVLYSPASRDFVDQAQGDGMYATATSGGDELWWSGDDPGESAYQRQYVAEYRGMIKLLVHHHVPFDAVVKPAAATDLKKYQVVIAPDLEAVSLAEASLLEEYVRSGGRLIVTGSNPGQWDEYGSLHEVSALAGILSLAGTTYFPQLLGRQYFTNAPEAGAAAATLLGAVNGAAAPWLSTDADRKVHMELSQTDRQLILQLVNFIGVNGAFAVVPTTVTTTLNIPTGKTVDRIELTSPDHQTPDRTPISFTGTADGSVTFSIPVTEYALVVVALKDAAPAENPPPDGGNGDSGTEPTQPPGTGTDGTGGNGPTGGDGATDGDGATVPEPAVTPVTPQTLFPTDAATTTGIHKRGTVANFGAAGKADYRVRSAYVAAQRGGVTDWSAATRLAGSASGVAQLTVTYSGKYSKRKVSQNLFLYNFATNGWDLVDTRRVRNAAGAGITATPPNPGQYVSPTGEMRARVQAFRAGPRAKGGWKFLSRARLLRWEVK